VDRQEQAGRQDAQLSPAFDLRREGPGDAPGLRALLEAAFPTAAEADLVDTLGAAGDVVVSMLAVEDGVVVAQALLSRMDAPFSALGLAPVAVRPGRQRQGLGGRVVRAALDAARTEGWVGVFVLGDSGWYGRFGFSADLAAGFDCIYAGPHFMAATLGPALPARSGRVAYAPAFDALG
jgi:putative acetyltransferase